MKPSFHTDEKFCFGCARWRTFENFHKRTASVDGLQYRCRDCFRENRRESDKYYPRKRYPKRSVPQ